jgi:coproporphyrinogen III oxidase-like Fe-S oxidoreductase
VLAERMLTGVMRRANDRYLRLEKLEHNDLPGPIEGREYLLYVHVPFCERLCPYCSFNRYAYDRSLADAYFRNLRVEMQRVAEKGYDFRSMYVGGGTPTIDLQELIAVIDLGRELFSIEEVSSETNPNHLLPEYIDPLAQRVQRFSVGVQSLDDGLLKQMDRYEKYGSSEEILERLRSIEGAFKSLNVDMIFNFPSQTAEMVELETDLLEGTAANQLTYYPLMASPAVRDSLKGTVGKVDYGREYDYYRLITQRLADSFDPASAWTFSRREDGMIDEYIVDYEDYVGVGSGAFSFLSGTLYTNTFSLRHYNELLEGGDLSVVAARTFSRGDKMRYRFLMQLFGLELDKASFRRDYGMDVEHALPLEVAFMRSTGGFAVDDYARLVPSELGRYLLVVMMRQFFVGVNNLRDQARAALAPEERLLLFGEGNVDAKDVEAHPLTAVVADTETAESSPWP